MLAVLGSYGIFAGACIFILLSRNHMFRTENVDVIERERARERERESVYFLLSCQFHHCYRQKEWNRNGITEYIYISFIYQGDINASKCIVAYTIVSNLLGYSSTVCASAWVCVWVGRSCAQSIDNSHNTDCYILNKIIRSRNLTHVNIYQLHCIRPPLSVLTTKTTSHVGTSNTV